jgi:hypothetical protein
MQRLGKNFLEEIKMQSTIEERVSKQRIGKHVTRGVLLEIVFSVRAAPSLYN